VAETKSVLIADDDDGYRFPIVCLFEDAGYTVFEATSQNGIMEHARNHRPQVWVIDVRLPTGKLEGIQAVEELLAEGVSCNRVFFISVIPQSTTDPKVLEVLASIGKRVRYEWIEKPFELDFLLDRVSQE